MLTKFLIDDANIERIRERYKYYPIDGVTAAVNDFVADFEPLRGKGKTMLNCEE